MLEGHIRMFFQCPFIIVGKCCIKIFQKRELIDNPNAEKHFAYKGFSKLFAGSKPFKAILYYLDQSGLFCSLICGRMFPKTVPKMSHVVQEVITLVINQIDSKNE